MSLPISWTKAWSNSDNGTILYGVDLGNIQSDIQTALANGASLTGNNVWTGLQTFSGGISVPNSEDHYRLDLNVHYLSSTDTIAVDPGKIRVNGTLISKSTQTSISIATAANYAGGSSQRAVNTTIWVGIDSSGNIKLNTTAATHADYSLSVTTGKLRYVTWSGTVYRVIGWIRTNSTGSGEIDITSCSNIRDGNAQNKVYYEKTTSTTGTTNFPIDTSIPQITEGTEMLKTGIVIGDANSRIRVRAVLTVENSNGGNGAGVASALFKTGTSNAKRTTGSTDSTGTAYSNQNQEIVYCEAASSVGWQEWSVRCGQGTSAVTLNYFQATAISTLGSVLEIEEIDP